jgi:hypothetical protein
MVAGAKETTGTRGGDYQDDPDEQGNDPDACRRALRRIQIHRRKPVTTSAGQAIR